GRRGERLRKLLVQRMELSIAQRPHRPRRPHPSRCPRRRTSAAIPRASRCPAAVSAGSAGASAPGPCCCRRPRTVPRGKAYGVPPPAAALCSAPDTGLRPTYREELLLVTSPRHRIAILGGG